MNRRGFLERGIFGSALLALGSGLNALGCGQRGGFSPQGPLLSMDAHTFAVVASVAEAVLGQPSLQPARVAHRVDELMSQGPAELAQELGHLTGVLNSTVMALLSGRLRPFVRMSVEERQEVLRAWSQSAFTLKRAGAVALRRLSGAAHYQDPGSWSGLGYPGPPLGLLDGKDP
jgi:hypothetical protein